MMIPDEYEALFLSFCLTSQNGQLSITEQVNPDYFENPAHKTIFQAIRQLIEKGVNPNTLNVALELKEEELNKSGGIELLESLVRLPYGFGSETIDNPQELARRLNLLGRARLTYNELHKRLDRYSSLDDFQKAIVTADKPEEKLNSIFRDLESKSAFEPKEDWEVFTLADAYKERPPLQWVISGLFSLPSLSIVYGAPGCMKSLFLADAAVAVAGNDRWLPPSPNSELALMSSFQTFPYPAMWIDFDNGKRRTDERFEAFGRARNLSEKTPLYYYSMPSPWLDANNPNATKELINRIKKYGAKFVILDNLGTISGGVDENSPEMIKVMSNLRQVAEKTQAAVIVIHHQRKGTGYKARAGEALRGHSSIEAALDLALHIDRKDDSDNQITIKSTKTRDVDVSPFSAEFRFEHKPGTVELATAKFFRIEIEENEEVETIQLTILKCVEESPGLSQNKLKDAVKEKLPQTPKTHIRNEILKLTEKGKLKVKGGGDKTSSKYHLPEF